MGISRKPIDQIQVGVVMKSSRIQYFPDSIIRQAGISITVFSLILFITCPGSLIQAREELFPEFDNSECLDCHDDPGSTMENAAGEEILIHVDPEIYAQSEHGQYTCLMCHRSINLEDHPGEKISPKVDCHNCHKEQTKTYGNSVHAIRKDAVDSHGHHAPDCADCHGSHNIMSPSNPLSPLYFLNLTETCGHCHDQVAANVAASIHGINKTRKESPTCTDCHMEHAIQPLSGAASIKISGEVCSRCHASERLSTHFELPTDSVDTFFDSYHGRASKLGSTTAANCASCHGYHLILPSKDPRSSIHKDNLAKTCGECHPGASKKFATGSVHHPAAQPGQGDIGAVVNYWVRTFYMVLIFVVIGGMIVHNWLAWRRKILAHLRNRNRTVRRMPKSLRIQHFILAISFIYLAISGFALAFPDSVFAWVLGSNEEFRRWSHRIAGIIMIVLGVFHTGFLIFTKTGRKLFIDMLPRWQDLRDFIQNCKHFFIKNIKRPVFGRFGYPEKVEYWAVFWGSLIMGLTGFMIWFKIEVTQWLPRWVIEVATTVHYFEAILAVCAILVWHFYSVVFDPDVYPMNWSWFDGKADKDWYEDEHGLDKDVEYTTPPRIGSDKD